MLIVCSVLVLYHKLHKNVKIDNRLLATMTCNFKDMMLTISFTTVLFLNSSATRHLDSKYYNTKMKRMNNMKNYINPTL